jgi:hypothetical protein
MEVNDDDDFFFLVSPSPLLPPSNAQQQIHTRSSPTAAVNRTSICREENTSIQSEEIDNDDQDN